MTTIQAQAKTGTVHLRKPSGRTFCGIPAAKAKQWEAVALEPTCGGCDLAWARLHDEDDDTFQNAYGSGGY